MRQRLPSSKTVGISCLTLWRRRSKWHAKYGGIVPEIASRQHMRTLIHVVDGALEDAGLELHQLDAVAVTNGPGLAGSLLVGVNTAKGLAMSQNLPFIGINHLEGHVYRSVAGGWGGP